MPVKYVGSSGATFDGWHGYFDEGGSTDLFFLTGIDLVVTDDIVFISQGSKGSGWTSTQDCTAIIGINRNNGTLEFISNLGDDSEGLPNDPNARPDYLTKDKGGDGVVVGTRNSAGGFVTRIGADGAIDTQLEGFSLAGSGIAGIETLSNGDIWVCQPDINGELSLLDASAGYTTDLFDASHDGLRLNYVITVDSSDNMYMAGRTNNGTFTEVSILKYNSSAVQQATTRLYEFGDSSDFAQPLAVVCDSSGNLYVAWYSSDADAGTGLTEWNVTKFNSSLAEQWTVNVGAAIGSVPQFKIAMSPDESYLYWVAQQLTGTGYIAGLDVTDGSNSLDMEFATAAGGQRFDCVSIATDSSDVFLAVVYDSDDSDIAVGGIGAIRLSQAAFEAAAGNTYGIFAFSTGSLGAFTDLTSSTTTGAMADTTTTPSSFSTPAISTELSVDDETTSVTWNVTQL